MTSPLSAGGGIQRQAFSRVLKPRADLQHGMTSRLFLSTGKLMKEENRSERRAVVPRYGFLLTSATRRASAAGSDGDVSEERIGWNDVGRRSPCRSRMLTDAGLQTGLRCLGKALIKPDASIRPRSRPLGP